MTYNMKNLSPKYVTIAEALKKDILAGKYDNHERFPSEAALARRFGASRPTIERALRELKQDGLLESRAGSGSYLTFAAKNATGAIGIIAPDYRAIEFFTRLCDTIASEARGQGYDVLLGDVSAPDAADRGNWAIALAQAYAKKKIAGVLLEPVDLVPDSCEASKKGSFDLGGEEDSRDTFGSRLPAFSTEKPLRPRRHRQHGVRLQNRHAHDRKRSEASAVSHASQLRQHDTRQNLRRRAGRDRRGIRVEKRIRH
jgi:DNA-binding transcriptional regulator YhcF (GntR family)